MKDTPELKKIVLNVLYDFFIQNDGGFRFVCQEDKEIGELILEKSIYSYSIKGHALKVATERESVGKVQLSVYDLKDKKSKQDYEKAVKAKPISQGTIDDKFGYCIAKR